MSVEVEKAVRSATRKDAYFWLVMMLTVGIASATSILISVNVNHRQVLAERKAREQQQDQQQAQQAIQLAQGEIARRVTCSLVNAQNDVYRAEPPKSPAEIRAAQAWHDLAVEFHC